MSDLNLRALVIGGARGIGGAVTSKLINEGIHVVFTSLSGSLASLEKFAKLRINDHQIVEHLRLDVRNVSDIESVIENSNKVLGGLDYLVYSPGGALIEPIDEVDIESWGEMLSIHCIGASCVIKKAIHSFEKSDSGSIVLISSISSLSARPNQLAYSSAKAAMNQIMRSYALELAKKKIRVNAVLPGLVQTDALVGMNASAIEEIVHSTPLKCLGTTKEIAECVLFLLSSRASFVTGHAMIVSGGR